MHGEPRARHADQSFSLIIGSSFLDVCVQAMVTDAYAPDLSKEIKVG